MLKSVQQNGNVFYVNMYVFSKMKNTEYVDGND